MKDSLFTILAFLLLPHVILSQCEVKEADVIIEGDNYAPIIQGNQVSIDQLNCSGNCYFFQEGQLMILQDRINRKASEKRQLQPVDPIKRKEMAENVVSQLPEDQQLCIKAFVQERITLNDYKVYEAPEQSSVLLAIPVAVDELVEFGLQFVSAPVNGISRVWRLGRFHFEVAATGECLTPAVFGSGCERYDAANDFNFGSAVVGKKQPDLLFHLIDTNGKRITESFTSIKESVYPNYSLRLAKTVQGDFRIIDVNGRNVIGDWQSIEPITLDSRHKIACFKVGNENNKFGLVDPQGKVILPADYDDIISLGFGNQYYVTHQNNKTAVLRSDNLEKVYEVTGDAYFTSVGRCYMVKTAQGMGTFYPKQPEQSLQPSFRKINYVGPSYMVVTVADGMQLTDLKGNMLSEVYESVSNIADANNLLRVKKSPLHYGYISTDGRLIVPCRYSYLGKFDEQWKVAWVTTPNDSIGVVSLDGTRKLSYVHVSSGARYDDFTPFDAQTGLGKYRLFNNYKYSAVFSAKHGLLTTDFNSSPKEDVVVAPTPYNELLLVTYQPGIYGDERMSFLVRDGQRISKNFNAYHPVSAYWIMLENHKRYQYNPSSSLFGIGSENEGETRRFEWTQPAISDKHPELKSRTSLFICSEKKPRYRLGWPEGSEFKLSDQQFIRIIPFKAAYTYGNCDGGGSAFIDLDHRISPCYPFDVYAMADSRFRVYAIIYNKKYKYGLFEVGETNYTFPLVMDELKFDAKTGIFSGAYQGKAFTFTDEGRAIPTFQSGDAAAFEAALKAH